MANIEECEQHLRARDPALSQQLVINAIQLALPDSAGGLQVGHRLWTAAELKNFDPSRDCATGDEHDRITGCVTSSDLCAYCGQ